jgi:hypothetical protein
MTQFIGSSMAPSMRMMVTGSLFALLMFSASMVEASSCLDRKFMVIERSVSEKLVELNRRVQLQHETYRAHVTAQELITTQHLPHMVAELERELSAFYRPFQQQCRPGQHDPVLRSQVEIHLAKHAVHSYLLEYQGVLQQQRQLVHEHLQRLVALEGTLARPQSLDVLLTQACHTFDNAPDVLTRFHSLPELQGLAQSSMQQEIVWQALQNCRLPDKVAPVDPSWLGRTRAIGHQWGTQAKEGWNALQQRMIQ